MLIHTKNYSTNLLDFIKNGKLEKTHKVTKVSLAQQQQNLLSDIDLCQRMFFLCLDNSLRRRIYVNKWRNMFCVPKVNNTGLLICMTPWNHIDRILYTNTRLSKSLCTIDSQDTFSYRSCIMQTINKICWIISRRFNNPCLYNAHLSTKYFAQ